jgi:prepilin-type N-terminal cleavage/methylation domain-containing protein
MSHTNKNRHSRGFSLIEVMIAIVVLLIGLLGLALTVAKLNSTTTTSRYLGSQAMLASEKLDDLLNRASTDPYVSTQNGTVTAGDLTSNQFATINGTRVNYFDLIQVSSGVGQGGGNITQADLTEALQTSDPVTGAVQYTVITHSPNGTASSVNQAGAPAATADQITYTRRWLIEPIPPTGAQLTSKLTRVTVWVSVNTPANTPGVRPFQMTAVRPGS